MKRTSKEEDACQRRSQSNTPHKTPSHLLSTEFTECAQRAASGANQKFSYYATCQRVTPLHSATLGTRHSAPFCQMTTLIRHITSASVSTQKFLVSHDDDDDDDVNAPTS